MRIPGSRVTRLLSAVLCVLVTCGCATKPVIDIPRQVLVPIVYVTDRNLNEDARTTRYYGGGRGTPQVGTASVAVSTAREDSGPFADWRRWEPRTEEARRRNELVSLLPTEGNGIAAAISQYSGPRRADSVLLYIHGFRRRFDTTTINFAKLVYRISPDAIPVLYSWPSSGRLLGYRDDVENLEWSNETLQSVLTQLLELPQIETVHVVAHSLGSLAFLEAIATIVDSAEVPLGTRLGRILLVSPDIARERFERVYLPVIRENDLRVTIYAAENDVPLQTSRHVNKSERVGDARARAPVYPGIETVLVSDVVSILNSHDSHLEVAEVQADIAYVINEQLPADQRPTLERADNDVGAIWRIRRSPGH